jgi:tRNA (guanine37-N1)-methyltransferase
MIKFDIITIFPKALENFVAEGIYRIAAKKALAEVKIYDLRIWSSNKHRQVDDRPYGGGAGMVIKIEPVYKALKELSTENTIVIMTSPVGQKLTQKLLHEIADGTVKTAKKNINSKPGDLHYIILCGHYEGFDERIREHLVDLDISVGDYVLSGGELPALTIVDGTIRLIPGVLGNSESAVNESFENDMLDYPVLTRPFEYNAWKVPEMLLKGHHKDIKNARDDASILLTKKLRSDLLK